MGDPAGIGPEIAVHVLTNTSTYRLCRPVLVGDGSVLQATMAGMKLPIRLHPIARVTDALFVPECIELIDLQNVDMQHLKKAQVSAMAGAAAYACIIRATDMALAGEVDAVVTCPINKDALNQAGYHYPGHTEILADRTSTRDFAMMLVAGRLRVVLVTIHLALKEAIKQIQETRILNTIRHAHEAGLMMGIENPRIGVPGVNPHAGEVGMFGFEEIEIIEPTIRKAQEMGYNAEGPFPADTIFCRAQNGEFDFVTPMYHDQGLIPIKLVGFGSGVNVTLGLPIIRTSVDHGTAFGKAWQFRANSGSLIEALKLAAQMAQVKRHRTIVSAQTTSAQ
jgi:4-hydroxythreonine-4-phosphate dehydrogenase